MYNNIPTILLYIFCVEIKILWIKRKMLTKCKNCKIYKYNNHNIFLNSTMFFYRHLYITLYLMVTQFSIYKGVNVYFRGLLKRGFCGLNCTVNVYETV